MSNEGYRKRLDEWENTQRRIKEQQKTEEPYNPRKMKSQAPLGCLIAGAAFALWVIYEIGHLSGFWGK